MATRSAAVYSGVSVQANKGQVRGCAVVGGTSVSIVRPAWAGAASLRKAVDWLPRIGEPLVDLRTGRITTRWYQFFRELAVRLGGLNGDSIQAVVDNLRATQAQLIATTQYSQSVGQYAQAAQTQVAALASASSASGVDTASVPAPSPPPKYVPPAYKTKYGLQDDLPP